MMKDTITAEEAWKMCIDEVLVDEARIEGRLDEIADEIAAKYRGCLRPLVVVPILKGGVHTGVGLMNRLGTLSVPCRIDFLWLASYCGERSVGKARLLADLQTKIEGEQVLLVDDLIDTGLTLATARAHLLEKRPASLEICVLLEKEGVRRHPSAVAIEVDYLGLKIENKFVVGMCNDFSEQFRNYNAVCSVKKENRSVLEAKKVDYEVPPDEKDDGARWAPPKNVDHASFSTYTVADRVYCSWAIKAPSATVTPPPPPFLEATERPPALSLDDAPLETAPPPRHNTITPPLDESPPRSS